MKSLALIALMLFSPSALATKSFAKAADQTLIKANAVKGDCTQLLGAKAAKVMIRSKRTICARMRYDTDTTMSFIDLLFGQNKVSPWDGDATLTASIFATGNKELMTVMILGSRKVLVLTDE